jgi:hypothetical protein
MSDDPDFIVVQDPTEGSFVSVATTFRSEALSSPGAERQLFVQDSAPADPGIPYLWIQTGLPNDGFTFWFSE